MQSKTGFPSSHQLKSYVAPSPAWNWRRAVLSADAGLLVITGMYFMVHKSSCHWLTYLPCREIQDIHGYIKLSVSVNHDLKNNYILSGTNYGQREDQASQHWILWRHVHMHITCTYLLVLGFQKNLQCLSCTRAHQLTFTPILSHF